MTGLRFNPPDRPTCQCIARVHAHVPRCEVAVVGYYLFTHKTEGWAEVPGDRYWLCAECHDLVRVNHGERFETWFEVAA